MKDEHETGSEDTTCRNSVYLCQQKILHWSGCVIAQRVLRRFANMPIDIINMAMQGLSKPKNSPRYVGEYVEADHRAKLFYKCPPDRVNPDVLRTFGLSFQEYTRLYYEPIQRNKCGNYEVYAWRLIKYHPFGPKAFPINSIRDLPPEVIRRLQRMANMSG